MCVRVCAQSRWLFAIPWTVACEAPLSMGFPSKNTGVGCHFLLQGIFPTQGLNSHLLCLLQRQVDSWPLSLLGSPNTNIDISKEIYFVIHWNETLGHSGEGLAHVNMVAEKFHNLLLASGGPGKPVVQFQCKPKGLRSRRVSGTNPSLKLKTQNQEHWCPRAGEDGRPSSG